MLKAVFGPNIIDRLAEELGSKKKAVEAVVDAGRLGLWQCAAEGCDKPSSGLPGGAAAVGVLIPLCREHLQEFTMDTRFYTYAGAWPTGEPSAEDRKRIDHVVAEVKSLVGAGGPQN